MLKDKVTWCKVRRLLLISRSVRKSIGMVPSMLHGSTLTTDPAVCEEAELPDCLQPGQSNLTKKKNGAERLLSYQGPGAARALLVLSGGSLLVRMELSSHSPCLGCACLFTYIHNLTESSFEFKHLHQLFTTT